MRFAQRLTQGSDDSIDREYRTMKTALVQLRYRILLIDGIFVCSSREVDFISAEKLFSQLFLPPSNPLIRLGSAYARLPPRPFARAG